MRKLTRHRSLTRRPRTRAARSHAALATATLALGGIALALGATASFAPTAAVAGVEDFSYDSWHVSYELSTDESGRAVAHVTETVQPRFPDTNQNRGIVRLIPTMYEGADTKPRDITVTDGAGGSVPFETEDDDGFRAILVGDDSYVHGLQTYELSYTLSDVILHRDDATADEFYWDLMDVEHQQPVAAFSAELSFSPGLQEQLNGNARCYAGAAEATSECALSGSGTAADPLTVSPRPLAPQEGVTVAIGLAPGAVTVPPQRLPNFALDGLPMIIGGVAAATGIAGVVSVGRFRSKRSAARGTVIAQYDVPAELPPLVAAPILGSGVSSPASAQLIHLAVSGVVRLEDGETEAKFLQQPEPTQVLRVVDPSRTGDPLDELTLATLIDDPRPGTTRTLPQESTEFATDMAMLVTAGKDAAFARGYLEKQRTPAGFWLGIATLAISLALFVFGVLGLAFRSSPLPLLFLFGAFGTAALGLVAMVRHTVHTRQGAEAREHLEGVKEFIRVAEADRIRMLQSASGAERRDIDGVAVIHLYERLLPYAMLMGLEKEWGKALEARYQAEPGYVPYWYPGIAAHGFAGLQQSLTTYTSAMTNAVSYTSSSTGGSTGGGFVGGGGGGGFSGGR